MKAKIEQALSESKVDAVWLVHPGNIEHRPERGVQVMKGAYDPTAPYFVGDEPLFDGGLNLGITAKQVLE